MGIQDCLGGGSGADPPVASEQGVTVNTAPVDVRLGFLRKVYTLLTFNFAITIAVACVFAFVDPVTDFVLRNAWITLVGFGVAIVALLVLVCVRPRFPLDFISMYVFVVGLSVLIGGVVTRYKEAGAGYIVLQAFITTVVIFVSITLYVTISRADFSFLYGFLSAGLIALIAISLMTFVFGLVGRVSRLWTFLISVFGALLMVGYILYDTSLIVNKLGPDDWLVAVVNLYMDVTNLFLFLLNIFSFVSD